MNSIKSAETLFSQYSSTGTKAVVTELDSCIQGIYIDLDDLKESVKAVEGYPAKFGLTVLDIKQRKKFIEDTQYKADELKKSLINKKSDVDRAVIISYSLFDIQALFRTPQNTKSQTSSQQTPQNSTNAQFIANEKQQQSQLLRQQDDQLDQVKTTVTTLKNVAVVMERELEDQSKLLEEMEIQVDTTQDKLTSGLKRVNDFLKDNASKSRLIQFQ